MIVRVGRHDDWLEWQAEVLRRAAVVMDAFQRQLDKAVREMADAIRAMAQALVHAVVWHELVFGEARPKKRHVFWRLVCWVVPRRLRRGRAAGIGCKNWRRS